MFEILTSNSAVELREMQLWYDKLDQLGNIIVREVWQCGSNENFANFQKNNIKCKISEITIKERESLNTAKQNYISLNIS